MLAAMGNEKVIGVRGDAERGEPVRHRLAMPAQALMRQIAEQVRHLAIGDDLRQHRGDDFVLARIRRDVQRQIDRRFRLSVPARLRPPPLHEGTAPDFAGDQSALFGFRIGFRNGADAEIEPPRHVTLGQQPHAGLDPAGGDVGFERQNEGEIARPLDRNECRYPVGHFALSGRGRRC
jgi:hypothetical protein